MLVRKTVPSALSRVCIGARSVPGRCPTQFSMPRSWGHASPRYPHQAEIPQPSLASIRLSHHPFTPYCALARPIHTSRARCNAGRKPEEEDDIHDVSSTAAALAYGSLRKQGTIRNLRLQPIPRPPSQNMNSDQRAVTPDDAWTREALAEREGTSVATSSQTTNASSSSSSSNSSSREASHASNAQGAPQPDSGDSTPASHAPDRPEDLLKLRSLEQADKGSPKSSSAPNASEQTEPQMIIDLPAPNRSDGEQMVSSSPSSSSGTDDTSSHHASQSNGKQELVSIPGDSWAEYLRENQQGLTPILYLMDTYEFAQRLVRSGWAGSGMDQGQQDKVASILAEGVEAMMVDRLNQSRAEHISSVDVEYQSYVFQLALNEVKTELEVRARNDGASLRSMTQVLQREVDRLSQKAREDVDSMQHAIQVAMNEAKTEVKGQQNDQEQAVQDLKHKLTIVVSTLKTGLEHSLKWDLSRRAFLLLFGQICFFFSLFKIFALFSKKDKGKDARTMPDAQQTDVVHGRNPAMRPQSAEDIGLVPHYENQTTLAT